MIGENRKSGQYKWIGIYSNKVKNFRWVLSELDKIMDKADDFGEMCCFLNEIQLGNGSVFQGEVLKDLDAWEMATEWWFWKHNLKFPCYFCNRFKHTKVVYGNCDVGDGEECRKDDAFVYQVKTLVEVEE